MSNEFGVWGLNFLFAIVECVWAGMTVVQLKAILVDYPLNFSFSTLS